MKTTISDVDQRERKARRAASLNRRRFLRGVGTSIALPTLLSLRSGVSPHAKAADKTTTLATATTPTGAPLRTAWVYVPNGAIPDAWQPDGEPGGEYVLNRTMEPLQELCDEFQILRGLACRSADPGRDGGGDHARAGGSFLTAARTRKSTTDIYTGVSIDQVIAEHVGHLTPLRSLELTCDAIRTTGSCDNGYSCAYLYNMSWRSPTTPVTPEAHPRLVFERMFGSAARGATGSTVQERLAQQKSILDFVLEDAKNVSRQINTADKAKLDEYLTSLRDIEQRIEKTASRPELRIDDDFAVPRGVPEDYAEHIRLMFEMLVLAFQSDQTRVATMLLAREGSNRPMPDLGIAEGHHMLSHHNNEEKKLEKVRQIDHWYVQQVARFLRRMKSVEDVDGRSLLDNSMILYGSGISDGNQHLHFDLPLILAGKGGGSLNPGRYTRREETPVANLYLSLADRMGCLGVNAHGDSTGHLEDL